MESIDETLQRSVDRGIISDEQADAIRALEPARLATAPRARRTSAVAEALGYVGAVLVMVGGGLVVARVWGDLEVWGRLTFAGAGSTLFAIAGALVDEKADAARWRLRGFLWLMSSAGAAFFAGLFAVDVSGLEGEPVALIVGLAGSLHAALFWRLRNRPLQHLGCLGGLIAATAGALSMVTGPAGVGLALWALGLGWALLGWRRLAPPRFVALTAGAALALVGASVVGGQWENAAPLIGLVTAVALLGFGIGVHEFVLSWIGIAGLFVYVPMALGTFFGDTLGAPIIATLSGGLLLSVALFLLRTRTGTPPEPEARAESRPASTERPRAA